MASEQFEPSAVRFRAGDLITNLVDFAAILRRDLGFSAGQAEAREALRALEIVRVADVQRVRDAMRLIFCTRREEAEAFDAAFDSFFLRAGSGARQTKYAPRHSRGHKASTTSQKGTGVIARDSIDRADAGESAREHVAGAWYSSQPGEGKAPVVTSTRVRQYLPLADKLVSSVRLGRLRRWQPQHAGPRFDMRRTMRASLHTGGDPASLRYLGHPLRNPRFVFAIDGSRSMSTHGPAMLEFAYALSRRWRRANVFLFSTELLDVTRDLRCAAHRRSHQLLRTGEAWGGGTQIGASLHRFVRRYGILLGNQTVMIVYSDGLDAGDALMLEKAMRELQRRCALIIWVNPLADSPNYLPEALGMRTALPFVDVLIGLQGLRNLPEAARRAS
jgi:uncharacterized protein